MITTKRKSRCNRCGWTLPFAAIVTVAAMYRPAAFAYRFVWFIYQSTKPVYRLAQNATERGSISAFVVGFVLARLLAVGGRITHWSQLTTVAERVANDLGFWLQGTRYYIDMKAGELFSFQEIYHERTYDQRADFVPEAGWTVLDVGANVGVFSVQQARRGAHVYAFEPNPDCFRRLSRIVAENHMTKDIDVFDYALGSVSGAGTVITRDGVTCLGVVVPLSGDSGVPTFQIQRLDEVASALGLTRVDLLKIDTEGAEVEVLHGAEQTLAILDRIILEFHSVELLEQSRAFLTIHGFESVLQMDESADPGRGVLYARRDAVKAY